ncbi:Aste57867_10291 [Aphanomyces stellatus]|uniref:Aste57867_10291 protein n=1 Tax=Aphanomyces stellatus TaxID=120398 RepID=A0A485KPY8_9STRA|nr:hypothetical protein As57867_010251 [Aphanomyces stellatus]VFT87165.1 Aste57867_10291 [Aphanomyces stellatus]
MQSFQTSALMKGQTKSSSIRLDLDGGDQWAYAMVFPNKDEDAVRHILVKLRKAALEVKLFYSSAQTNGKPSLIICKIRANLKALRAEAARTNLPMLMDPEQLRAVAKRGLPAHGVDPFEIGDENTLKDDLFHPYEHIHMKYDLADDVQDLYARGPHGGHFSSTQRMMLIDSIIVNVARVNVDKLRADGVLHDCFPLHENDDLAELEARWVAWNYMPWNQPISHVKNYFGSKVAMYFAYLGYYTTWLGVAGFMGFLVFLAELIFQKNLIPVTDVLNQNATEQVGKVIQVYTIPAFGFFMVVWATLFLEGWKRKSARYALEWGTATVHEDEQPRPQFHGITAKSPITGAEVKFFDPAEKLRRRVVSWLVLFALLAVVVMLTAGIFYLRFYFRNKDVFVVVIQGHAIRYGTYLAAMANLAQIFIMYKIYDGISLRMNDYENHSTESSYEANYILKAIIFHFVNSYAALIYVASMKERIEGSCLDKDCFNELRWALVIIYGSQIVIGNFKEILVPRIFAWLGRCKHKGASPSKVGAVEDQFFKSHYGWKGTFDDFLEMIIQFGYSSFFVVSFPLTPLLSFVNNVIEIRIDGYRLTHDCRRPRPRHAANIGLWITVLELFVTVAIITNGYVIFYTRNYAEAVIKYLDLTDVNADFLDFGLFVAFVTIVLLFRGILAAIIPDVPEDVAKQLARQAFLTSKILDHKKDDTDEALTLDDRQRLATILIDDIDDDQPN